MLDIAKLLKKALRFTAHVGIATIAATSAKELPAFKAPCRGRVTKLGFVPQAAITGVDGNNMIIRFKNKGAAGTGTDVMATKTYVAGEDVAAFDFEDLGAVANAVLEKDDTVTFEKAENGTGMVMPDLIAVVEFAPDLSLGD